ncbi:MAG: glycosyltransferase family 4 protein [Planctomycetota bacterium]
MDSGLGGGPKLPGRGPILIVSEYGTINGGENSLLAVLPSLIEKGFVFEAAVPGHSAFAHALSAAGVRVYEFSFMDCEAVRKSQADIRAELVELIRCTRPLLLHCNSLASSRICGPVAKQTSTPAVGYLRDILNLSRRAIEDINQLDQIVAVSAATRQWHVERGMDASNTIVIHNGIDVQAFAGSPSRPELFNALGIEPDDHVLLSVGQIGMRKGLDVLLEAIELISTTKPVHMLIAGERYSTKAEAVEYEQNLREKAAILSRASDLAVHFIGLRSDVPDLMHHSTLLLHPARQEPLGRVLLEACAAGLPVVTTDVGGSPEIFASADQAGQLVPAGDAPVLAGRVESILDSPEIRHQFGITNRRQVESRFTIERCAQALAEVYGKLIRR